jgi:hypothetical protein
VPFRDPFVADTTPEYAKRLIPKTSGKVGIKK